MTDSFLMYQKQLTKNAFLCENVQSNKILYNKNKIHYVFNHAFHHLHEHFAVKKISQYYVLA